MMIDLASAIKAGTVIYHADMAAQCATEALALPCTQTNYKTLTNHCLLAFEATIAAGGACHTDFECLTDTGCKGRCDPWDLANCCTGACASASAPTSPATTATVGDGEICTATGTVCENLTSYCDPTSGTCQARLLIGAKCSSASSCIGYAMCNGGACQNRPVLGETCKLAGGGFARCLAGACDQNNLCAMTGFIVKCF